MQGCFYELKWTVMKLGKVDLFQRNFFFLSKSDKGAYITGFNRGVLIILSEVYNYMHACREAACCALQKCSGVCSSEKI